MRKAIVIQGGPPNRAQETMDIINEEVLNDVGGQWTFTDVGGGIHVPHDQLDPQKNWANLITHPTQANTFAIPLKGDNERDRAYQVLLKQDVWDRLPQQARDAIGNKPNQGDDIGQDISDWFPEEQI